MKHFKRILALICVFVLCFAFMAEPAFAVGSLSGQQFGAWIASALTAINIVGQSILPAPGPVDPYFNWLSSPSSATIIDYQYPQGRSIISDYLNASTIKVSQGVTTIDGVEYDELWISPDTFTNGLKTEIFDFKTKWALISGQAGTLAKGVGYYEGGLPAYRTSELGIQSQFYTNVGDGTVLGPFTFKKFASLSRKYGVQYPGGYSGLSTTPFPWYRTYIRGNPGVLWYQELETGFVHSFSGSYNVPFTAEEFQFDYVSGVVPAESSDIPEDFGLSVKIPHEQLQTFYSTYPQYNLENTTINIQEDNVDIDELTQAIFDLIESMDDIKAEWTSGEEPEPPVPVDPIDNIDDNVQSISEYQESMNSQVSHMHQDVEAIHQTQIQQQQMQNEMQQTQQEMQQNTESIDDTLKDIKDSIEPSEITAKTFDLRELFPFCIPFDIYHLLQKFNADPVAPHVQLPFVIESIGFSYMLDLDFSAFDPVAQVMRTVEFIVFAIGLAWATSKVIKW